MDVAVGIVRMAGVGTKLSTALMCYAGGVADADKNMTAIAGDVALTSNVLASVGHFLKEKENDSMATPSALKDAQAILTRCHNTFEEIKGILDKTAKTDESGARKTSKRARLIWPVKSNKAELLTSRLESLKSSLMLLLQVLSFAKDWATGNFGPQSVTERCDSIRGLHRREKEALAAESDLEKRMGAASLRSPASRNDETLLQGFDNPSCGLPRSNMDCEQKTRPSNEQAFLFQNLHVDSEARMPAQTERGQSNKEDQIFDASTRTLPRTTNLPSKALLSSGVVASKNKDCLQQLETLKQETQMLLTSIQETYGHFLRGSMSADEAMCFLDSRYENFSQKANSALKMPWIQQTWLPQASFQQPQLNMDLTGIGTCMRPQDNRRRGEQPARGPSHSPLSDHCMAETAAQGQQGGSRPPEPLIKYQEQLLLLERQNKQRLLFARQEQEDLEHQTPMPSRPAAVMSTTESREALSAYSSIQQPCQEASRLAYQDRQRPTVKDNDFALDFAVEGSDVLENFDFDSFLHNTDDNNGQGNFDFTSGFNEPQSRERGDESGSATNSHSENMEGKVPITPLHSSNCFARPQSSVQINAPLASLETSQKLPREKTVRGRKGPLALSTRQQCPQMRKIRSNALRLRSPSTVQAPPVQLTTPNQYHMNQTQSLDTNTNPPPTDTNTSPQVKNPRCENPHWTEMPMASNNYTSNTDSSADGKKPSLSPSESDIKEEIPEGMIRHCKRKRSYDQDDDDDDDNDDDDNRLPQPLQTASSPPSVNIHDNAPWTGKEDIVAQLLKRWTTISIPIL